MVGCTLAVSSWKMHLFIENSLFILHFRDKDSIHSLDSLIENIKLL